MGYLLDTQIMIWVEMDISKISKSTQDLIFNEKEIYFSYVSVWEMAIKLKTEKLILNQTLHKFISDFNNDYGFLALPISVEHIYKTQELDFFHRDPFDRLLIAQSIIENHQIISSDSVFDDYIDNRIW